MLNSTILFTGLHLCLSGQPLWLPLVYPPFSPSLPRRLPRASWFGDVLFFVHANDLKTQVIHASNCTSVSTLTWWDQTASLAWGEGWNKGREGRGGEGSAWLEQKGKSLVTVFIRPVASERSGASRSFLADFTELFFFKLAYYPASLKEIAMFFIWMAQSGFPARIGSGT